MGTRLPVLLMHPDGVRLSVIARSAKAPGRYQRTLFTAGIGASVDDLHETPEAAAEHARALGFVIEVTACVIDRFMPPCPRRDAERG